MNPTIAKTSRVTPQKWKLWEFFMFHQITDTFLREEGLDNDNIIMLEFFMIPRIFYGVSQKWEISSCSNCEASEKFDTFIHGQLVWSTGFSRHRHVITALNYLTIRRCSYDGKFPRNCVWLLFQLLWLSFFALALFKRSAKFGRSRC